MFRYLFIILSLSVFLQAGEFSTPPMHFPETSSPLLKGGPTNCFISSTNQVFYTWAESNDNTPKSTPFFALYDAVLEKFIITRQAVKESYTQDVFFEGVNCCYNSSSDQVILSWANDDNRLMYAFYDVKTQTIENITDAQTLGTVINSMIFSCYNQSTNQVIFSWKNFGSSKPNYATLNANKTLSTSQVISDIEVKNDVYCCSLNSDEIVFSYPSAQPNDKNVYVSVLKLTSGNIVNKTLTTTSEISNDVFCSFDIDRNLVFLSYASYLNGSFWKPYFAIFDLGTYSFLTTSSQLTSATSYQSDGLAGINVYSCYSPLDKKVYFSWGENKSGGGIYYATYDSKRKKFSTPATTIGTDYALGIYSYGVYMSTGLNRVFFSWANLDDNPLSQQPWYAIYSFPKQSGNSLPEAIRKFSRVIYQKQF